MLHQAGDILQLFFRPVFGAGKLVADEVKQDKTQQKPYACAFWIPERLRSAKALLRTLLALQCGTGRGKWSEFLLAEGPPSRLDDPARIGSCQWSWA